MSDVLSRRVTMLISLFVAVLTLIYSFNFMLDSFDYEPVAQRVLLDTYNRPVGDQDLLAMAVHNPDYPVPKGRVANVRRGDSITDSDAEPARYFAEHMMLDIFKYDKFELESGEVLRRFLKWCSEDEAVDIHNNSFRDLSQQRIVLSQDARVRPEIIGDFEYKGFTTNRPYESKANYTINETITMLFEGKMLVTVFAKKNYPTYYDVAIQVQRAVLQDKIKGYQCTEMTLR